MRKIIVLSSIAVLLLTSCLKEGNRNYAETSLVLIEMNNSGVVYGKTFGYQMRLITSPDMQLLLPGEFKFITYSWEEEYGTTPIGTEYVADNVVISGEIIDVDQTYLSMSPAPEQEEPSKFVNIATPLFASDEVTLNDHWLFEYTYEATKDETATVEFYWDEERSNVEEGKAFIDIRLVINETSGGSLTSKTDIIALDMAPLRNMYEGTSSSNTKRIDIQFTYYRKDRTEPVDSQVYQMLVAAD